jgi:hypothetical protein
MSTGCPHLKRARWSSLRPGVFLLWYVSFSNFLGGERQRWNFCPGVYLSYAFSADTNAFVSACPFIVA